MNRHLATVLLSILLAGCAADDRSAQEAPAPEAAAPSPGSGSGAAGAAGAGGGVTGGDAAAIAAQMPYYTLADCPVCGKGVESAGGARDVVQGGKLVRVCCDVCAAKLRENPEPIVAARDSALIVAQLASYPTDSCVVMGESINVMETPTNFIYGARLIRLCCDTCVEQFLEDPAPFIAILDAKTKAPAASLLPEGSATN